VNLFEVILNVRDMEAQTRFYRDMLGLDVDVSGGFWTTFRTGDCTLALHGGGDGRIGGDAARIVFRVDDVEQARLELLSRGVKLGEVRSPVDGVRVVDGKDPEGNSFHLEQRS
jgi:catechol 2,3-dioxygenase-like lactoylglutathione lyase family enzyme